ncbi:MAG: amidohydrolase [Deltaproteobacteria bacterium]|nr:amidohydrolase [Deltaproteobacteria bacterium]
MGIHDFPLIDVDAHYTEPPDLWLSRAPAALRDVAPRVVKTPEGNDTWIVGRDTPLSPPGFCVIRTDGSKAIGSFSVHRFDEMIAAASDPAARVRVMQELGISRQVLYPNVLGFAGAALMRIEDAALRDFCITAYNDGVADVQRASGGRLLPQAMLPFWDVRASARELERCHEQLGLTGFTMMDAPEAWGMPSLADSAWDPLWSTAQERRLPVNFHIGSSGVSATAVWPGIEMPRQLAAGSTVMFIANARCIVNLIFSGLLDRFPSLNFVSVESGVGWLPFAIEAAEYQVDENGVDLALRPSEYFRRQIYASFWFEQRDLAACAKRLGTDNVMVETDFPHPTCLYPGPRKKLEEAVASLSEADQRKIFYGNAARVYGVDPNP